MRYLKLILRLRFRLLLASVRQRRGDDGLESISRVLGLLIPALLALGMVAIVVGAAVGGAVISGMLITRHEPVPLFALVFGLALLLPLALMVTGPLFGEGGHGVEREILLRVQPIPARVLHGLRLLDVALRGPVLATAAAFVGAAFMLFAVGPGLAAGAVGAVGALCFLALLVALGDLAEQVAEGVMRRRRLSGWFRIGALVLVVALASLGPLLGPRLAPLLGDHGAWAGALPWLATLDPGAAWATAVGAALTGDLALAAAMLGLMVAVTALLFVAAGRLHRRLLEAPPPSTRGAGGRATRLPAPIPFCRPATAAVARAHLRLVLRTTRGRLALIGPAFGALIFAGVARFGANIAAASGPVAFMYSPLFIAALAVTGSLGNLSAITGNQLAALGQGLVLERLLPLDDATLLRGAAVGGGLAYGVAMVTSLALTFPILGPPWWMWTGAFFAGVVVYAGLAPVQAAASAVFPVVAKLGTMSKRGGPHPLVRFGLLALGGMGTGLLILLAWGARTLGGPWLVVGGLGVLAAGSLAASGPLLDLTARVVGGRMENVLAVATGR